MKLATPYTWEAVLSRDGNTAESWEQLIESGRLPFMAMVRNVRNFLRAGVSPRHHKYANRLPTTYRFLGCDLRRTVCRIVLDRLLDTNQVLNPED